MLYTGATHSSTPAPPATWSPNADRLIREVDRWKEHRMSSPELFRIHCSEDEFICINVKELVDSATYEIGGVSTTTRALLLSCNSFFVPSISCYAYNYTNADVLAVADKLHCCCARPQSVPF